MSNTLLSKLFYAAKSSLENPENFIRFIFGRFNFVRLISSDSEDYSPYSKISTSQSFFANLDINEVLSTLRTDGFFRTLKLPEYLLNEIVDFTTLNDCYAGGKPEYGFKISEKKELEGLCGKPFYMADYFNVSQSCSAISKIVSDPVIQAITKLYIGEKARYTGCSLTWIFPTTGVPYDANRQESCTFHYDVDDFVSLRFFFYLTRVDAGNGPHVCALGSHRKKKLRHVLNFWSRKHSDQEITQFYGSHRIIEIHGEPGSGFIEDTFCFHKGTVPTKDPRLMLMLHFASHNYNKHEVLNDYRDLKTLKHFKHLQKTS